MKQTKWQRLATIGLCSSLVINAFSGVTAVAETVTIESSPTAESSAKEETPASSVKEETTKASTENSQVTTDTSQEEATKEAEKQEEADSKIVNDVNSIVSKDVLKEANKKLAKEVVYSPVYPGFNAEFFDEENKAFTEPLNITGEYVHWLESTAQVVRYTDTMYPMVSSKSTANNRYKVMTQNVIQVPSNLFGFFPAGYTGRGLGINKLQITTPLRYVDKIELTTTSVPGYYYKDVAAITGPPTTPVQVSPNAVEKSFVKNNTDNTFSIQSKWGAGTVKTVLPVTAMITGSTVALLIGFNADTEPHPYVAKYKVSRKQVTEKFVNASGVAITPPTGFTQNKKTPMTSNDFTFKQAGTLPDTYTTGGKTYKFKGWYKGKTKPSTLTTTKAPSYKVTYDGNDDLTVMYEEIEAVDFPALTYQFGFVNESGQRVDASTIKLTYDTWFGEFLTGNVAGWKTVSIEQGKVAPTKNNLKEIAYPAQSFEIVSGKYSQYSAANLTFTPPRYYEKMSVYNKSGAFDASYPFPNILENGTDYIIEDTNKNTSRWFELKKSGVQSFIFNFPVSSAPADVQVPGYLREVVNDPNVVVKKGSYSIIDKPIYYYLTNRKVTENFVDTSGAKITPPTGFTQGKQTAITSDPYTFKQAGTLPDTYTTGGKTYKFKGWYKGKSILNTLTTTKAPSYQVTYDDNDDLNVVYEEETVTTFYPSLDVNFVNEKGGAFTPALTFSGKYYVRRTSDSVITNLYDVTSKSKGNGQYTVSINNGSVPLSQELFKKYTNGSLPIGPNSLTFRLDKLAIDQQLKYVDSIQVETAQSSGLNVYRYDYTNNSSTIIDSSVAPTVSNLSTTDINGLNFKTDGTNFSHNSFRFLGMTIGGSMNSNGIYLFHTNLFSNNPTNDSKLVYKVTRKQVTENFVDANGAKITAPTGFTQGNQVPMNSNTFKYTAAKALPATYTAGGKTYTFQGWYKGKTKPSTLNKTTTPTFNATFDGNDDMTAMYKEEIPTASVTLTRPKEVIDTNTNVIWTTTITNTSKAPLQNLTLKKGPNWSAGLTIPTFMEVTPEGETTKSIPVNSTLWTNGVSLPNAVPIGKKVSIAFTTRATGKPNTVLKAEVVVFGGIKDRTVDNFVRIRPNDQEVVTPTTEGFISVPTFDFGQVGVAGSKQQHSLKQAADYYGNGTRNPYVRIKKTQPNWSLTAQLSQPKSATDSLPTATRLLLGAEPVSSFTNYNQPTELKNAVGTTSAISLTANNTATSIIANKQFTGSNVYQLDFTFNNVKLEVPANQGVKGQQYKAAVTWNLVTGP